MKLSGVSIFWEYEKVSKYIIIYWLLMQHIFIIQVAKMFTLFDSKVSAQVKTIKWLW